MKVSIHEKSALGDPHDQRELTITLTLKPTWKPDGSGGYINNDLTFFVASGDMCKDEKEIGGIRCGLNCSTYLDCADSEQTWKLDAMQLFEAFMAAYQNKDEAADE